MISDFQSCTTFWKWEDAESKVSFNLRENIMDISKNYSFSRMSGKFECNDIMGILEHLADNDISSLNYIDRLEKIIFLNSKKLRKDDLRKL